MMDINRLAVAPHSLDYTRLQVLESQSRSFLAINHGERERVETLHRKQMNLESRRRNLEARLAEVQRSGNQVIHERHVFTHDDKHPLSSASHNEKILEVDAELSEVAAALKEAEGRAAAEFEKFNATEHLIKSCKAFINRMIDEE